MEHLAAQHSHEKLRVPNAVRQQEFAEAYPLGNAAKTAEMQIVIDVAAADFAVMLRHILLINYRTVGRDFLFPPVQR